MPEPGLTEHLLEDAEPLRVEVHDLPEIDISEEQATALEHWLSQEIEQAISDRGGLTEEWKKIQRFYEETELTEKKDWPFKNAATLMVPVLATFVETIWSKVVNTIFTPEDPFHVSTTNPELGLAAIPFKRFLTWATKHELDLERVGGSMFMEMIKLGSCVSKTIYTVKEEEQREYDPVSGRYETIITRTKDQPEVIHVPLADFFFPTHARALDECEWKAHRVRLSWGELQRRESLGIFQNVDRIKAWDAQVQTDYEAARAELEDFTPHITREFEIYEVWCEYVVDDDEEALPQKIVTWFHPPSNTRLRTQYNWYPLQLDPFDVCGYMPREHRILSIGVGKMTLPFQSEITAMHNQRLDSATVKNAPVFKEKRDSVTAFESFYPGARVKMDDTNDLEALFMGQPYDSTIQEEQHTLSLLQQRVGMHEYQQSNMANMTSTSAMMIMQESTRRFDIVIRQIRAFLTRIMKKVVLLYATYSPQGRMGAILGQEDGQVVEGVLGMPVPRLASGMVVEVTATTSVSSKELERQAKLSVYNLLQQHYQTMVQYYVQANSPELPPHVRLLLLEIVRVKSQFVSELLEDFDVRDRRDFGLNIDQYLQATAGQIQAEAAQGAGDPSGMGGPEGGAPPGAAQAGPQNQAGIPG